MPYTQEELLEMYRKLPKEVQEAIFSVDTAEIIRQIGEKHKLMIDKIGELADETGLIMLGLSHPSQYILHLSERLGVSREIAREIAQEVNAKIFAPIREHLKKIHGLTEKEATIPPEPTAPAPSPPSPPLSSESSSPVAPPVPPPISEAVLPKDIFETKTKEEIFRTKPQITEEKPTMEEKSSTKKIDPYREPIP